VMDGYSELFGRLGRNPQSAALLALTGTIAILLVWNFVSNVDHPTLTGQSADRHPSNYRAFLSTLHRWRHAAFFCCALNFAHFAHLAR